MDVLPKFLNIQQLKNSKCTTENLKHKNKRSFYSIFTAEISNNSNRVKCFFIIGLKKIQTEYAIECLFNQMPYDKSKCVCCFHNTAQKCADPICIKTLFPFLDSQLQQFGQFHLSCVILIWLYVIIVCVLVCLVVLFNYLRMRFSFQQHSLIP